jgi:phosphatidylinositol alpha-1,6-mannosyltransferase
MKILFITRKYPPSTGGMELFAYDLSNALAAKTQLRLVKWSGTGRIRAVLIALPYLGVKATAALLKGSVDIIHVQDGVLAPLGYLLARLFRKPFTINIHGLEATYQNRLFKAIVPWTVRRAALVFCISRAAATEVEKLGVDKSKIKVIPLAVTDKLYGKSSRDELLKRLDLPDDSQILLTVGRLVKRKGVAWFVNNVTPGLAERYPKLVYLVVGEGAERPAIETAVTSHNLETHVKLLGKVNDDLYESAYNGADVFVMPNINIPGDMEGFGLVLLEASLCALPVVAADTEGIKDAVTNGKNGILVPVLDTETFQAEISRFLDDKNYVTNFGKNSRNFTSETYRWDKIADRYLELYRQLL